MVSSSSPKIDRDVLMQGIVEGIAGFESEFPLEDFKKGDYKQHPIITLLTCSDSRMPVNIFGSIFNRIFSVENIGNQFRSSEGSVLYGLSWPGIPTAVPLKQRNLILSMNPWVSVMNFLRLKIHWMPPAVCITSVIMILT